MSELTRAVRTTARCRRWIRRAEALKANARTRESLLLAERMLRRVVGRPGCAPAVRRAALEKLALMLSQQPEQQARARAQLRRGEYEFTLSSEVLCYPLVPSGPSLRPPPPPELLSVKDEALPAGMLAQLQRAFSPSSPFWSAHNYRSGDRASPFFSYVHHLDRPPRTAFDRVLAVLHAHVSAAFPHAKLAKRAEWWAHCRPHGTGHQFHFDSDDEGRGGVRNPIVSSALYLTGGIGGPTLVTDQPITGTGLAERGWATLPHTNRCLMFDGRYLHGVIPGRDVAPTGAPSHRISMMVAFWPEIRERTSREPVAARPFPYGPVADGAAQGWPTLFDWPEADDRAATGAPTANEGRPPPSVWCVDPVWQRVDGGGPPAPGELPPYEACFQGF